MKLRGIKQATDDFNHNQNLCARIYLDCETGDVWTNIYPSVNDWTQYHKLSIREVRKRSNLYGELISMKELRAICYNAIEDYNIYSKGIE